MNKYFRFFTIEEVLIGAILFSLPISLSINSIVIITVTLFFLYKTIRKGNFKNLIPYYISAAFFLAQFISYLLSNDKQEAGAKLLLYASFLLFSISFSYLTSMKIKLNQNTVFKFLLYGTLTILIYGVIRFLYDIIFLDERYDYGRAVALLLKYIPHHIYMSMFILISIYATFVGRIENNQNRKSIYILPFLYLFLILLGSRMAILLSVILLPVFLSKKLKEKKNQKKAILLGGILISILIIIGFSNNYVRDKIMYSYYDLLNIATKEKPFFGVSFRQQVWSSVFNLIHQSPFLGYGIGDIQEVLNNSYQKKELIGLNAHNQYFQLILQHGTIIFFTLALFVFKLIKQCVLNKKSVLLFSWLIVLFFCLTESILNRQWGVILFAFIVNYSIYSNSKLLKTNL